MLDNIASMNRPTDRPVTFVTGAGGDIGRAIVEELGVRGWAIALAGRRTETLEPVSASLRERGVPHLELPFDVTDAAECATAIEATQAAFGRLDCLVNNAATWFTEDFLDSSDEHWRRVMDVNLIAPARLARLATPMLTSSPAPRIVNVSSKSAFAAERGLGSYGVSKAALNGLTMVLAAELGPLGISVIGIAPGVIETSSNDFILKDPASAEEHRARIPIGRFGRVDEVAKVVTFFCKDAGAFATGTTILMDGGQLAWH
ncbi:MAG: SDR family oxidoreductase [Actinobacteria bacterium]|nr:SDR family oxidoreductase [Actinomycetota bacterium]